MTMENASVVPINIMASVNSDLHTRDNSSDVTIIQPTPSEPHLPSYATIYVTIFNVIIFVVGVLGNILVIVVMAKVHDMRTTINLYLVNLSIADLLVLMVCQPIALQTFYFKERWYLGAFMCHVAPVLEHSVLHASIMTIMVISCERYNAICRPLRTFLVFKRPRPLLVALLIWSLALMTSLPFFAMSSLGEENINNSTVKFCVTPIQRRWQHSYVCSVFAVFFALPMLLLSAMYGRIMRQMYRHRDLSSHVHGEVSNSTGYNLRSRRQVIRMLIAVVILFFLSLAPFRVMTLWFTFSPPGTMESLGIESYYNILWMCRMLVYVNSAGNPVIYSLLSYKFQRAFLLLIQGKLPPSGSSIRYNGSTVRMSFSTVPTKRMSLASTTLLTSHNRNHNERIRSASMVTDNLISLGFRHSIASS